MKNAAVVEKLFPLILAFSVNKTIIKRYKELESKRNESVTSLLNDISTNHGEFSSIEKMANDAYDTELQRKSSLELKGAALLGAVAVAVSIISISIGLFSDSSRNSQQLAILGVVFTYAIIHLISCGMTSIPAITTYRFHITAASDIIEGIKNQESLREKWIANKIIGTRINSQILLIINNYVSASITHFKHGLIALAIGYLILYAFEVQANRIGNNEASNMSEQQIGSQAESEHIDVGESTESLTIQDSISIDR